MVAQFFCMGPPIFDDAELQFGPFPMVMVPPPPNADSAASSRAPVLDTLRDLAGYYKQNLRDRPESVELWINLLVERSRFMLCLCETQHVPADKRAFVSGWAQALLNVAALIGTLQRRRVPEVVLLKWIHEKCSETRHFSAAEWGSVSVKDRSVTQLLASTQFSPATEALAPQRSRAASTPARPTHAAQPQPSASRHGQAPVASPTPAAHPARPETPRQTSSTQRPSGPSEPAFGYRPVTETILESWNRHEEWSKIPRKQLQTCTRFNKEPAGCDRGDSCPFHHYCNYCSRGLMIPLTQCEHERLVCKRAKSDPQPRQ
jgi:hypothetical protein